MCRKMGRESLMNIVGFLNMDFHNHNYCNVSHQNELIIQRFWLSALLTTQIICHQAIKYMCDLRQKGIKNPKNIENASGWNEYIISITNPNVEDFDTSTLPSSITPSIALHILYIAEERK